MRRYLIALTVLAVFAAFADSLHAQQRPNIIFIFADDLGWGDLGCYGNNEVRSPNLDRLAKQGTLFTQFYVNGSVCSPSRTAFMTGHYPSHHRVHGHFASAQQNERRGMPNWLDANAHTLPRLLKEAGYATAHFGKWHLGSGRGAPPVAAYGFDEHRIAGNGPVGANVWEEAKDEYFRARSTDLIVDETIRFIESHRDRPFYVQAWALLTHATLHPQPAELEQYKRFAPTNVPYFGAKQIYYASVTALDAAVGRLMTRLDELGLADNTIIVFSSDNGPEDINIRNAAHSGVGSAGPFRGRKRSIYEGGVRMPFIVRWPALVPAGRVNSEAILTAVDFLPTMCNFAGVDVPNDLNGHGEDVGDILLGSGRQRKRPIMWEWRFNIRGHVLHQSPQLAIRDGRWKLMMNPDGSRVELYDIPADPSELHNRADDQADVVKRLSTQLLAWHKTLPSGPVDDTAGKNDYPWPRAD